jgi:hypothetical protein
LLLLLDFSGGAGRFFGFVTVGVDFSALNLARFSIASSDMEGVRGIILVPSQAIFGCELRRAMRRMFAWLLVKNRRP